MLNDDSLVRELFGVEKYAINRRRENDPADKLPGSVAALREMLRELMAWVWKQTPAERLSPTGQERCAA